MSDPQAESKKTADPLEQWRELRDAYIDVWAKATGEAVNSEAYAQASGTILETALSTSAPFRDAQKKIMVSALEQLNMPSRADFVSLAERLANLELLLDDMDAKLTQIHHIAISAASQPAPKTESETKPHQATTAASQPKAESETLQPKSESEKLQPKSESETKSAAPRKAGKTAKKGI